MPKLVCARCGGDPSNGAVVGWTGPASGHNYEKKVVCEQCLRALRRFLKPSPHVLASDPVTAEGLAHIDTCELCRATYGVGNRLVSRETSPRIITKKDVDK